jgi:hypothetical protein
MWTFEVQWPAPFSQEWLQSSRWFKTPLEAAQAAAEYLAISAENGTIMATRLSKEAA